MDSVIKLLDRAKISCKADNDSDLAKCLHVTRSAVSNWRTGKAYPDEVSCAQIAKMIEEPLARVLGIVGEARAKSSAAKAVWRRLASAAVILIALVDQRAAIASEGLQRTSHNVYTRIRFMFRRAAYSAGV